MESEERAIEICRAVWKQVAKDLETFSLDRLDKISSVYDLKEMIVTDMLGQEFITKAEYRELSDTFFCSLCVMHYDDCSKCLGYPLWTQDLDQEKEDFDSPCEGGMYSPYRRINETLGQVEHTTEHDREAMIDAALEIAEFDYEY